MKNILILLFFSLTIIARDNPIGKEIFIDKCAPCHTETAYGNRELEVPPIAGLPRWYITLQLRKFQSGERGKSKIDKEAKKMREVTAQLTDRQITFVGSYVASLPPTANRDIEKIKADPKKGNLLYQEQCFSCHSTNANGNKKKYTPPLNLQSDWYLKAQLFKFNQGLRKHHEQKSTKLTELQISRLVKYLISLPHKQKK